MHKNIYANIYTKQSKILSGLKHLFTICRAKRKYIMSLITWLTSYKKFFLKLEQNRMKLPELVNGMEYVVKTTQCNKKVTEQAN